MVAISVLIFVDGKRMRVNFDGGVGANNYRGMLRTSDPKIQKAIEGLYNFGTVLTGEIYLDDVRDDNNVSIIDTYLEIVPTEELVELEQQEEEQNELSYSEVKRLLIEKHGVHPDELKNMPMLKKKIKDLGLNYQV